MVMKVKRKNTIKIPKVLCEKINLNIKPDSKSVNDSESLTASEISTPITFNQENIPPISSRLRSKSMIKTENNLKRSNTSIKKNTGSENSSFVSEASYASSQPNKKRKVSTISRNISKLAVKKPVEVKQPITPKQQPITPKQQPITPKPRKLTRNHTVLIKSTNATNNQPELPHTRYLLRSRSVMKSTIVSKSSNDDLVHEIFRTPQPPIKPLSELNSNKKPATPIKFTQTEEKDLSQISDFSNTSTGSVSATLLSRFVKKKSKMKTNSGRNKIMRKFELSQDSLDTSSCASVGEESISASIATLNPTQKILDLCNQKDIKTWSEFISDPCNKTVKKVGEGVYGEVFMLAKGTVLKVFPVDGDILANGEVQMTMDDVFPELFVSKKLTELNVKNKYFRSRNYVQLKRASLLIGKLPAILIQHWKHFKVLKGTDNELLDFLPTNQKWVALEYEFAGIPLPDYKFSSRKEVRCIIEQISLSLAVAESALQFEHRDLHWLNILVKSTKMKKTHYKINNKDYSANCNGIFATIIDFTVSRMCVDNNTVYMDMSDCPEIFEGEGDYQFELYRMMKNDNKNNWREFHPRTNLYWIHYLIDKFLNETRYPRGNPDNKTEERELRQLYDRVLSYHTTNQLIEEDDYFAYCRKQTNNNNSSSISSCKSSNSINSSNMSISLNNSDEDDEDYY